MSNDKQRTPEEILNDLYSFAYGNEDLEDVSTEKALKNANSRNVDLDKMLRLAKEQATISQKRIRLQQAKARRQKILKDASSAATRTTAYIKEEVLSLIRTLEVGHPGTAAVYFNRFKECSEEDMQSLKEDLMLLDELDSDDEK